MAPPVSGETIGSSDANELQDLIRNDTFADMELSIIIAGVAIMVASLSGVVFTQKIAAKFLEERLSYLVSFSAGVFLITAGALALEVFELAETTFMAVLLIALGYGLAWGIQIVMPESHQHHDPNCAPLHQHGSKKSARKLIIGDAVHNVADGIILVPAFMVSPALGIAVTVSILIHEVLQEISEFFILKQAGYSTKKALAINFMVSSTIFIGIALGYFAVAYHNLEVLLLAVSAGFFLHVVMHDLLPRPHNHENKRDFLLHVVVLASGLLVMASVALALGDSHVHGGGAHDHDHEHGHSHDHGHSDDKTGGPHDDSAHTHGAGEEHHEDEHHKDEHHGEEPHSKETLGHDHHE